MERVPTAANNLQISNLRAGAGLRHCGQERPANHVHGALHVALKKVDQPQPWLPARQQSIKEATAEVRYLIYIKRLRLMRFKVA
jgi:hypothetical protein